MTKTPTRTENRFAFMTVTALFFMWGFISCMNDLLIPKFKADFSLTQFQANLVQFAFFGAYFLVSLAYFLISATKGDPINKIGYKNGLVLGLVIAGIGCLLFYPAAETKQYILFLGALIVLGSGITIIQIAARKQDTADEWGDHVAQRVQALREIQAGWRGFLRPENGDVRVGRDLDDGNA